MAVLLSSLLTYLDFCKEPPDPRGDAAFIYLIFDPLGKTTFDMNIEKDLPGKDLRMRFTPVHMLPGSLRHGERFLETGKLKRIPREKEPPQDYLWGINRSDYLHYADSCAMDERLEEKLPAITSKVMRNTGVYRALFKPLIAPDPPYILWMDGPTLTGRPAYPSTPSETRWAPLPYQA
ncbi:MAG: hypothetical protein LBR53_01495 [Deltaproteobacteria bacterium]|nr:hypothetical protein [Deltaproteobacteria bacterium]